MSLANILFAVVMLHLLVGFGWALYKLEFQKNKKHENPKNGTEEKQNRS